MMNVENRVLSLTDVRSIAEAEDLNIFECCVKWQPFLRPKGLEQSWFTPCLAGMATKAVDKYQVDQDILGRAEAIESPNI